MQTDFANLRRWAARCALAGGALLLAACGKMSPEEMLNQGHMMMQNRDIYGAEMQFQKIIAQYPESKEVLSARVNLIYCFQLSQDIESALQQTDKVIEMTGGPQSPQGFPYFIYKVRLLAERKDYQKALDLVNETSPTLKSSPLGMRTALARDYGLILLDMGQRDKAKELSRSLMDLVAGDPGLHGQALQLAGLAYDQKEDGEKLLGVYSEYLKRFPASPLQEDIKFASIQQMKKLGRGADAKAAAEDLKTSLAATIAKLQGDAKADALIKLAIKEQALGETDGARKRIEGLLAEFPKGRPFVQGSMAMASIEATAGDRKGAIERLQKAIQQNPGLPDTQQAAQLIQNISQAPPTTATLAASRPTSGAAVQAMAVSAGAATSDTAKGVSSK